jgi:hypothetical protein
MLVQSEGDDHAHELIEVRVVLGVGDAARFNDEQALEGVDYFLNLLPLVGVLANLRRVPLYDLVDALVFLDEDEEEIMRSLAHLCLG